MNLSAYPGGKGIERGTPLVYDVQVNLNAENEAPTAEMKWDPTGPGFAVYESFIGDKDKIKTQITIEYFYPQGKKVTFIFLWAGQSINYGNDMAVTVKMVSELAGLVNGNIRSTAQAYDEKKGAAPEVFVEKLKKQFAMEKYPKIIQYNKATLEYWKKVKLLNQYGNDWTFGNAVATLVKQTGDQAFPINISQSSVIVMPPFSWQGDKPETVEEASTSAPTTIDPTVRYGYLLGPSIINSISRQSMWKPPQQSNDNMPGKQRFATNSKQATKTQQNHPTRQQQSVADSAASTSGVLGPSSGSTTPSVASKDNPKGPERQNALNQEKGSELSFSALMCPLLVGLKPHDILYVPSLKGGFIEDWIVQSVGYSQQNGSVELSVQATRVLGFGAPMNKTQGEKFLERAESLGLVGPNATLDAWDSYAWSLSGKKITPATATSAEERFFNPTLPPTAVTPGLLGGL